MPQDLLERIRTRLGAQALPFLPATEDAVERTEQKIGLSLPPLLKTIYLEIGNGGFGPGLGIIGIEGGSASDFGDVADTYIVLSADQPERGNKWVEQVLPFCSWGNNIFACVRCENDFPISISEDRRLWPKEYNLALFFELWLGGADILAYDSTFEERTIKFTNTFTGRKETMITKHRTS